MTVVDTVEKIQIESKFEFTKLHRCDRCIAQAYVRVTKSSMELLFCNHHFRKHEPSLVAGNWMIDDQSETLLNEVASMKKMSDSNF